jgi:hypothetical protein
MFTVGAISFQRVATNQYSAERTQRNAVYFLTAGDIIKCFVFPSVTFLALEMEGRWQEETGEGAQGAQTYALGH